MALYVPGKSACAICGNPIASETQAVAFPAFVPAGHEFSSYSDGVFHRDCFASWEDHARFQQLYDQYDRVWKSRPADLSFSDAEAWAKRAFDKVFSGGMVNTR